MFKYYFYLFLLYKINILQNKNFRWHTYIGFFDIKIFTNFSPGQIPDTYIPVFWTKKNCLTYRISNYKLWIILLYLIVDTSIYDVS